MADHVHQLATLRGELREEKEVVKALEESKQDAERILSKKIVELSECRSERDQARNQERQRIQEALRETGLMLQKWARTKRHEAKEFFGPEKLKAEWIAKGYDNAADALFAALDTLDPSGEEKCENCGGKGWYIGGSAPHDETPVREDCEECDGTGKQPVSHPSGEQGEESKQEQIEALEERLGDAEAELDKWEPVLVAADRVSSAYAAALAGRDLGGLPQWEKGEDGQFVNGRKNAPTPATDTSKEER
jgi:hypothetical protein